MVNVRVLTIKACSSQQFYGKRNKICVLSDVCTLLSRQWQSFYIYSQFSRRFLHVGQNVSISSEYLSTFLHSMHVLFIFIFQTINLQAQMNFVQELQSFHFLRLNSVVAWLILPVKNLCSVFQDLQIY